MARTVDQIYSGVVYTLTENFSIVGIKIDPTTWSRRNIMRLFCYSFAVATAYLEQLQDQLKAEIEQTALKATAASAIWIKENMKLFQYSATVPQYIQLIEMQPQYTTIDPTLRIITACSVVSGMPNQVLIKVAKNGVGSLTKLTNAEKTAAQSYINTIADAGVNYEVISQDPDLFYISADIYYSGINATVKANIITALVDFLRNNGINNFDGVIKITDIENTIRSVSGVNDVVLKEVRAHDYTGDYSTAIALVQGNTLLMRQWHSNAGYCDQEVEMGYTFADTLNMIAE